MSLKKHEITKIKQNYPRGTRVELIEMDDYFAPPQGTKGTVISVDNLGSIHVEWDTGSTLALIPDIDRFKRL